MVLSCNNVIKNMDEISPVNNNYKNFLSDLC